MSRAIKDLLPELAVLGVIALSAVLGMRFSLLAGFSALFGILYVGGSLGRRLFADRHLIPASLVGIVLVTGILATIQTIWFYAGGKLATSSDPWTLLLSLTIGLFLCHSRAGGNPDRFDHKPDPRLREDDRNGWSIKRILLGITCFAVTALSSGYVLLGAFRGATTDSIRTTWPLLPAGTLTAIALAWAGVLLGTWLVKNRWLAMAQAMLALFATTAIAPLIYQLGYGFDGFLHLAGERVILATGTLSPKPLSYIGQYAFTTWLVRLTDLPLAAVERWLVPAASAILLPLMLAVGRRKESSLFEFGALALIPLAPFVATTPQSFAYLLGLAAFLLVSGNRSDIRHSIAALILAAWCVAVHPLAGAPCFVIVLALSILPSAEGGHIILRNILAWILAISAALSVPLLFAISSATGATPIQWNIAQLVSAQPWLDLLQSLTPWFENRFVVWSAWAALIEKSIPVILCFFAVATIIKKQDERHRAILLLVTAILLFLSSAALKTAGDFAFLIDYERGNYADRLRLVALLCLIPAALPGIAIAIERMRSGLIGAGALVFFLAVVSAQSYAALPRHDAVTVGRGWSVGRSDFEAVRAIDRDAGDRPYTVLANQSVSAAAVGTLGFKRYHEDVFFYPIPTGGALYETFLRMTYEDPSNETVKEAASLGGTDLVYVVINDYWWNAEQLNERINDIALDSWIFGETDKGPGRSVRVYAFDINTLKSASTAESGS